jgi:cytochrome c2
LSLSFSACSSTSDPQPVDASDVDGTVSVTVDASASVDANCDPSLTYASFGMNFFATYCNRCHFWDQESAQLDGQVLTDVAGTQTFMPPSAPFPVAAERMQLVQWITCGAP